MPPAAQPKPEDYDYDLDRALGSVVGIRSVVPADAFSAETLGTERAGNGVLIREDGVVLTIGYLITEAESIWLTFSDGRAVPGHVLGYDQETGFGLVQALARLDLPALPLGQSSAAAVGEQVVVGGAGGRHHSVAAHIAARQEFAGYWEYVLDEAIFTAPAHPNWGGTALIGPHGDLLGIGSLQLEQPREKGNRASQHDRADRSPEADPRRPAHARPPQPPAAAVARPLRHRGQRPDRGGRACRAAGRRARPTCAPATSCSRSAAPKSSDLAGLFRRIWSLGDAGVEVPLTVYRDGQDLRVDGAFRRPPPVPEGAAAALRVRLPGHPTSMMAHGFIAIATRCLWPERLWAGSRPRRACRER